MNITHQQLLELMRGSDSKSPMTLEVLGKKSGLTLGTLTKVIDQMHSQVPALVGKCDITKAGIKQVVVWPTGVVTSFKGDIAGAREHARNWSISGQRSIPRNPIQKPQEATQPPAEKTHKENTMANAKYKAIDIVKKVHDKSSIHIDDLIASFAPSAEDKQRLIDMIKYCIKCDYLEKKAGNILVLGINEVWLARHNLLPANKSTEVGVATNQSESAAKPAAQQTSPQAQASSLSGGDQSDVEGTTSTAESTAEPGHVNEDEIPAFLLKPTDSNTPSREQNGTELIAAIKHIFERLPKLADITIGRTSEDKLYVDIGMLNGEVSMPLNDDLDAVEGVISAARVIEQYRQI